MGITSFKYRVDIYFPVRGLESMGDMDFEDVLEISASRVRQGAICNIFLEKRSRSDYHYTVFRSPSGRIIASTGKKQYIVRIDPLSKKYCLIEI